MNHMSKWVALHSLTRSTSLEEAIALVDEDPVLEDKLNMLISAECFASLRDHQGNPERADRLLEIAEEWCSFSRSEQQERLEEMRKLFCYSTDTEEVADAIAQLDAEDQWEDFIDMINDPEVFEQDGEPTTRQEMLELVEVAFGVGLPD
jgi:hypothetical protein